MSNYTIEYNEQSTWVTVRKDGEFFSLCMDESSGLHSIWVGEGKPYDDFFVVDKEGIVNRIDRGVL